MPMHDWTRVPSGLFHDFHQTWSITIKVALNAGLLPKGYSALVEQRSGQIEADVLTIEQRGLARRGQEQTSKGALMLEPPRAPLVYRSTRQIYAGKANRIAVKHRLGRTVAVIEILSPGNKDSRAAVRDFVEKTVQLLRKGVHLLLIDLFPPTPRDPGGMHQLIWEEVGDGAFVFPEGKNRLVASYEAGNARMAYVYPLAVGDVLPGAALFLAEGVHIEAPLESSYAAAWAACPAVLQEAVETGILPNPDADEDE